MIKYQHKNFGKKLCHRAGLVIHRPNPRFMWDTEDLGVSPMKGPSKEVWLLYQQFKKSITMKCLREEYGI